MGTVYKRGNVWWIGYVGISGEWEYASAKTTDKAEAKKVLAGLEAAVSSGDRLALRPKLVTGFGRAWAKERGERAPEDGKVWTASKDLQRLESHVFPVLGHHRLDELRPGQVQTWFRDLKKKRVPTHKGSKETMRLAPRTLRNIFGALHSLFEDAVAAELVDVNPCVLRSGDMPSIVDKDPDWRDDAVFTREEVELLISTDKIKNHHRVWWALGFLTGMRPGEVSALHWMRYRTDEKPMPMLQVRASYNLEHKVEKSTKTGRTREVPVHPTLALILDDWKARGWAKFMGREPKPDDLIMPNELGEHLTENSTRDTRPADLRALGLRVRRFHDGRATFMTLGAADGAEEVWLERVTHNAKGTQAGQYRRTVWTKLCEAVSCLDITLRAPAAGVLQAVLQSTKGARQMPTNTAENVMSPGGFEPPKGQRSGPQLEVVGQTSEGSKSSRAHGRRCHCSNCRKRAKTLISARAFVARLGTAR